MLVDAKSAFWTRPCICKTCGAGLCVKYDHPRQNRSCSSDQIARPRDYCLVCGETIIDDHPRQTCDRVPCRLSQPQVPERTRPAKEGKDKRDAPARAQTQHQETKLSLMNGAGLCPTFQIGTCRAQGSGCAAGLHRCAVVTNASGRVCGSSDHGANNYARREVRAETDGAQQRGIC